MILPGPVEAALDLIGGKWKAVILFRRRWSSVYKALLHLRVSPNRLMVFLLPFLPTPPSHPLLVALDHTPWPRLYAPTLKDRTFVHHPTVVSGNKPITLGHGYSTLAIIPELSGSWALPLRHERITSFETPISRGIFQLKQLCCRYPHPRVLLADSEYANAVFLTQSAQFSCDKLMRLRPNRVLWTRATLHPVRGRPRRHGHRFALKEPNSWLPADTYQIREDEQQGKIRLRLWKDLHFKQAYDREFSLVQVELLDHPNSKPIWLLWTGESWGGFTHCQNSCQPPLP